MTRRCTSQWPARPPPACLRCSTPGLTRAWAAPGAERRAAEPRTPRRNCTYCTALNKLTCPSASVANENTLIMCVKSLCSSSLLVLQTRSTLLHLAVGRSRPMSVAALTEASGEDLVDSQNDVRGAHISNPPIRSHSGSSRRNGGFPDPRRPCRAPLPTRAGRQDPAVHRSLSRPLPLRGRPAGPRRERGGRDAQGPHGAGRGGEEGDGAPHGAAGLVRCGRAPNNPARRRQLSALCPRPT